MYRPSPTRPVRGKRAREMRPDTHFEPHEHAWAQIAYCVSGTLQVSVQDVRADHDVSYVVPSSRAVWIAPRSRHTVAVLSWAELHTLYVDPGAAPSGWQASRMFAVSPLLRELIVALERVEPGPREAHLAALTLLELRSAEAAPLGVPLPRAEGGDKRLRALCEAVLHAPAERATLADWAGRADHVLIDAPCSGRGTWRRLSDADKAVFTEVLAQAADRCSTNIRQQEQQLVQWFRDQGKTVQNPDIAAFRAACVPLHNENVGWTRAQYDRLQAL